MQTVYNSLSDFFFLLPFDFSLTFCKSNTRGWNFYFINVLIANVLFPSVPMWQVVSDKGIPVKNLNEIKSVLVSALASHGQMSDALDIYEEIKQVGSNLEPKAVISLIVSSSINDCILSLVHAMTGS